MSWFLTLFRPGRVPLFVPLIDFKIICARAVAARTVRPRRIAVPTTPCPMRTQHRRKGAMSGARTLASNPLDLAEAGISHDEREPAPTLAVE